MPDSSTPARLKPAPGTQLAFDAPLESWAEGMDYCAVAVPPAITETLGTKGPVLVMARVNDSAPFQVSLIPAGGGQHFIRIKSKVRRETGTRLGDVIRIRFTVLDRAAVKVPDDLASALAGDGSAAAFQALAPGRRSYLVRRIDEAVQPATRARRVQEAVTAAREAGEKAAGSRQEP